MSEWPLLAGNGNWRRHCRSKCYFHTGGLALYSLTSPWTRPELCQPRAPCHPVLSNSPQLVVRPHLPSPHNTIALSRKDKTLAAGVLSLKVTMTVIWIPHFPIKTVNPNPARHAASHSPPLHNTIALSHKFKTLPVGFPGLNLTMTVIWIAHFSWDSHPSSACGLTLPSPNSIALSRKIKTVAVGVPGLNLTMMNRMGLDRWKFANE